ncbi:hypothetical protein AgCh_011341 [Apium graveolens]
MDKFQEFICVQHCSSGESYLEAQNPNLLVPRVLKARYFLEVHIMEASKGAKARVIWGLVFGKPRIIWRGVCGELYAMGRNEKVSTLLLPYTKFWDSDKIHELFSEDDVKAIQATYVPQRGVSVDTPVTWEYQDDTPLSVEYPPIYSFVRNLEAAKMKRLRRHIPEEIITLILQRLPAKSLLRFRYDCYNDLARINPTSLSLRFDEELEYEDKIFLWNPAIKKIKLLPDALERVGGTKWITLAFGFSHKANDFKVVKILDNYRTTVVEVYSLNAHSWKRISDDNVIRTALRSNGEIVLHESSENKLVSYNVDKDEEKDFADLWDQWFEPGARLSLRADSFSETLFLINT